MRLKCKLGIHAFEVIEEYYGTAHVHIFLKDTGEVTVRAEIIKCKHCSKEKAYVITGSGFKQEFDVKLLRLQMKRDL